MKKSLLKWLLAVATILTVFVCGAIVSSAKSHDLTVTKIDGTPAVEGDTDDYCWDYDTLCIFSNDLVVSGTTTNELVCVFADAVKLQDLSIQGTMAGDKAVDFKNACIVTIAGDNYFSIVQWGIYARDSITLQGSGYLNIAASSDAIMSDADIVITGSLDLYLVSTDYSTIAPGGKLTIDITGSVYAESAKDSAIYSESGQVIIKDIVGGLILRGHTSTYGVFGFYGADKLVLPEKMKLVGSTDSAATVEGMTEDVVIKNNGSGCYTTYIGDELAKAVRLVEIPAPTGDFGNGTVYGILAAVALLGFAGVLMLRKQH